MDMYLLCIHDEEGTLASMFPIISIVSSSIRSSLVAVPTAVVDVSWATIAEAR